MCMRARRHTPGCVASALQAAASQACLQQGPRTCECRAFGKVVAIDFPVLCHRRRNRRPATHWRSAQDSKSQARTVRWDTFGSTAGRGVYRLMPKSAAKGPPERQQWLPCARCLTVLDPVFWSDLASPSMTSVMAARCLPPVPGIAISPQKTPQIVDTNPFFNWYFRLRSGMLVSAGTGCWRSAGARGNSRSPGNFLTRLQLK